jgi:hypothetical protein
MWAEALHLEYSLDAFTCRSFADFVLSVQASVRHNADCSHLFLKTKSLSYIVFEKRLKNVSHPQSLVVHDGPRVREPNEHVRRGRVDAVQLVPDVVGGHGRRVFPTKRSLDLLFFLFPSVEQDS